MASKNRAITVLDWVTNIMAFLAGVIIAFVTLLITAAVISRTLGGGGLPWNLEVTEYALLYICFLAAPWVLRQDAHVRVDFVTERIRRKSERAYAYLQWVTDGLMAAICLVMTVFGTRVALDLWSRHAIVTSILNWPKAPLIAIIPFGFLVMLAQIVRLGAEREQKKNTSMIGSGAIREGAE